MTSKKSACNKWFEERRDIFIRNVVHDFLKASIFFKKLYEEYNRNKRLTFDDLDFWVGTEMRKGPLWELKDLCHKVWADGKQVDAECVLFDWLIGSIFHEGMKLKENIYLLQHYKPIYEKIMQQSKKMIENRNTEDYIELFKNTTEEVQTAMTRLNRFFLKASGQLYKIILKFSDNHLIMRLLVENESEFDRLWGLDSVPRIFEEIFNGQREKGYCLAAKSYWEGNWLQKALQAYKKALNINPDNVEAQHSLRALKTSIAKQDPRL